MTSAGRPPGARTAVEATPIGGGEYIFATVLLAILPLVPAVLAAGAAQIIGGAPAGGIVHFVALTLGWLPGTTIVVRYLRRRLSDRPGPSSVRLFLAAAASFASLVGVAVLLAPWQELMSEPRPTPLMVVKDLTSTYAPALAGLLAPWCVLAPSSSRSGARRPAG